MRLLTGVGALLVALVVVSTASADRTVTSPGRILGLARSGYSVAFLSGPTRGHCGPHVELWDLVNGGVYRLGRHTDLLCSQGPSTGSGVTDLAVAHRRVLWLAYAGGNQRDWLLYTATVTRPVERRLELRTVDVDAPPPIVLGVASEYVLPYSVGSAVKVLADNGRLLYRWQAPGQVTNTTAYNRQVAVFVAGGSCFVLSPRGTVEATYTFPPGAVQELALAETGLVVQLSGGRIEIHKGTKVTKLTIPARARMVDFAQHLVLYELGSQIRARRVSTGKDVLLRRGTFAQLEHNGLSYVAGRKVSSVAMVNVLARLR
jgi:hypothetical protein